MGTQTSAATTTYTGLDSFISELTVTDDALSNTSEILITNWKALVDEFGTRLMIGGVDSEAIEHLRVLHRKAAAEGAERCAEVCTSLLDKVTSDFRSGVEYLLQNGIVELQNSVEPQRDASPKGSSPATFGEDAELVADFVVEAREHLSQIEGQMLILERDPSEMEVIHAVFRAFHTIKGLAGFLDFGTVQAVAHEVETLLDLARNEKLAIQSSIVDVVLESGDFLLNELTSIERTLNGGGALEVADHTALAQKIRNLALPQSAATPPDAEPSGTAVPGTVASHPEPELLFTTPPAPQPAAPFKGAPAKEPARSPDASSVRVETAKLDHLMDMVGEIVIAQSLIRHNQAFSAATDSRLLGDLAQLARVTGEVQRATMSMRMIPVGNVFQRVERVIRDLSRKAGKQVVLETEGSETEIDKTVAEELSDPLLHMVRNSVDHGIETSSERVSAGKPAEARIKLAARHQGGLVILEISDDGRGLNSEKIRRKAEERNLVAPNAQLTETEIFELIFAPGFSTADKITDVSGRGVGMDVVRRNVEKLRGRIETQSVLGQGTTFSLKLPLTLAIIDGLVVEVGAERYIIPLSGVREIFKPTSDALFTVEGRDEMLLVRGKLLPIVRLAERLGILGSAVTPSEGLIVVVESHSRSFCLLVDDLLGKQEVVIKSLGEAFKDVSGLSGCAVLGDGRVGLILDIDGIYRGGR